MNGYIVSKPAKVDLWEIAEYISNDSIDYAERMVERIHDAMSMLNKSPRIGRKFERRKGYRVWPVRPYLIIYSDSEPIIVVRIIHGARDLDALFGPLH